MSEPGTPPNAERERTLRAALDAQLARLDFLSSKGARAEAMLEVAKLRWQLGEIDDDAYRAAEELFERLRSE